MSKDWWNDFEDEPLSKKPTTEGLLKAARELRMDDQQEICRLKQRIAELEAESAAWAADMDQAVSGGGLEDRVGRMRVALRQYADEQNWHMYQWQGRKDPISIARRALGLEKDK